MSKNQNSCSFRTSIGGQALMEGILMRGPKKQAIVCCTAEGLVEKVEELKVVKEKYPILGWPFVRGLFIFLSSPLPEALWALSKCSTFDVDIFKRRQVASQARTVIASTKIN